MDTPKPLSHALAYAERGFGVLPLHSPLDGACSCRRADCDSPAKHPRTAHGLTDASTDLATIRKWWSQWPAANVGIVLPDDLLVVDVDTDAVTNALDGRELPTTATAKTGRGWQFLYRTDRPVAPRVAVLEHVDFRGPGSYICAPPSQHINGATYVWIAAPKDGIADAPTWVYEVASPKGTTSEPGAPILTGQRNDELARLAGSMRHHGMTADEITTALLGVNARCDPPLSDSEVRAIAASVGRYAPGERGPRLVIGDSEATPGIDAADLLALDIPPLRWIVPDLLPEGTTVLASPPKVGKSCLVYQIATEASVGGTLLGRPVTSGSALYLALEDGKRRGQDRLRAALAGRTMPRGRLEVRWTAHKIGAGLEDDLARWLDAHSDAALVAIDTLGKVRPRSDGRRNAYEVDVEDLGRLQSLFRDRSVALLIVHHARKEAGDDFLASVSGTYGLTGSADTIIVVKRKRLEAFGTIVVTGRDVPDAELPARFDGLTWQAAPQVVAEASFERAEVYRTIEEDGPIFPAAIATKVGLERTSVQHMVGAMVAAGAVARTAKGYMVPNGPELRGVTLARARTYPQSLQSLSL
ncbi:MAG: bifunctional DNA primase/polymerase [Chloroflexi bacterium]|nr:bifunctional DNA primase/polymerase [Chloroflexota bacterium]